MLISKKFGKKRGSIYTLERATIMLPLLNRICADLEENMERITVLTAERSDDEDIELQLRQRADRHQDLKREVAQLKGTICHAKYGFIDIPVWHPHLSEVVHVCVSRDSMPGGLKAHLTTESAKDRRFFLAPLMLLTRAVVYRERHRLLLGQPEMEVRILPALPFKPR